MFKYKYFIIILLIFTGNISAFSENEYKVVKGITFKGLEKVSKYKIIRDAGIKIYKKKFVYNPDILEDVLSRNCLINNFKIIEKNSYLTIIVSEKTDVLLIAVADNGRIRFCEVDHEFNILSIDKIHDSKYPLILIDKKDVIGKKISKRIKRNFVRYYSVSEKLAVRNEIRFIDMRDYYNIKIMLKNRKTTFSLLPEKKYFLRLSALIGYLDLISYYPDYIQVKEDHVVLH